MLLFMICFTFLGLFGVHNGRAWRENLILFAIMSNSLVGFMFFSLFSVFCCSLLCM